MAGRGTCAELGFVEETEPWRLLNHFFPSKVGGKPSWLSLKPLPTASDIQCPRCKKPCVFLVQLYASVQEDDGGAEAERDDAKCFHRTIFVFVCRNPSCCKQNSNDNFVVLTSQLPRKNEFYSSEPPNHEYFDPSVEDLPRAEQFGSVCVVCGCAAPSRCSRCQKAAYCSKEHQAIDWKAGHKKVCNKDVDQSVDLSSYLLPEYEVVTEEENFESSQDSEKTDEEKMREYEQLVKSEKLGSQLSSELSGNDLEKMSRKETQDDKMFKRFRKRVAHEPEQVLRIDRGGIPLWVSSENIPSKESIPRCSCGAERCFEFQVMPQLLNFLKLDSLQESIDWGTLVVYTCSANCDTSAGYRKEFLWKQDFTSTDVVS